MFFQSLYVTAAEWQFRIPLIIAIIALVISMIPVVQLWIPSSESDHLAEINYKISTIESLLVGSLDQEIWSEFEELSKTMADISTN